tara:strand:- start:24308 stop:24625 length:318 start_codon:yes stop_codon:yes gene_type:complete
MSSLSEDDIKFYMAGTSSSIPFIFLTFSLVELYRAYKKQNKFLALFFIFIAITILIFAFINNMLFIRYIAKLERFGIWKYFPLYFEILLLIIMGYVFSTLYLFLK